MALQRYCSERDYILFLIDINTGLCVGNLLNLKVSDLKGKRKAIVKEGKTQKKRTFYLDSIYDEVQKYISTLDSDWLFPSRKGNKAISPTQGISSVK